MENFQSSSQLTKVSGSLAGYQQSCITTSSPTKCTDKLSCTSMLNSCLQPFVCREADNNQIVCHDTRRLPPGVHKKPDIVYNYINQ